MAKYSLETQALISVLGDEPIAYRPILARVFGGVCTGVLLSQLLYWHGKQADKDGWIWKTTAEMTAETALSEREQETARKYLLAANVIKYERRGMPRMPRYFIDHARIAKILTTGEDVSVRTKRPYIKGRIVPPCEYETSPPVRTDVVAACEDENAPLIHRLQTEITTEMGAPISGADTQSNITQLVSPITETNNMNELGNSHDLFFITAKDDIERKIATCKRSDAVKDVLKKFHSLYPDLGWTKAWLSGGEDLANVVKGDLTLMDEAKKKLVGDYTPGDPRGMIKTCNKARETRRQQVTKDEPALVQMSDGTWAKSYNPWS